MTPTLAHGTWPSPIAGADIAAGEVRHEEVLVAGGAIWFTRTDPATGASRLHRWTAEDTSAGGATAAMAPDVDVRSRVHEYGEGGLMGDADVVVVVDVHEQRLHRVRPDGSTTAITPATDARVRFSAGRPLDDRTLVAVREVHQPDGGPDDVVNELVAVDLRDGSQVVLVEGHDFVGDPAIGPDGRVAWSTWEHPAMPWDDAILWAGRWDGVGLVEVRRVAGGDGVSLADWAWAGHDLVWADDRSGWWELHRTRNGSVGDVQALTTQGIDLGHPRWSLGFHTLALAPRTRDDGPPEVGRRALADDPEVWSVGVDHARSRVGVVVDGDWVPVSEPDVTVRHVAALDAPLRAATGATVVTSEVDLDGRQAIRLRNVDGDVVTIDEIAPTGVRPGDVGEVVDVQVQVEGGHTHAFFHPPANADVDGPDEEAPPLVVFLHGGPTSHVPPVLTAQKAFWTTRGFAVVDLNHRGSTGFGRDYRRAMRGRWGEIEVDDAISVACELARRGWVDGDRMAIRGGSAGGFSALAAVTRPAQPFACATSFFGVTDLAALAEATHKFESRYLDSMVGPLPAARELYDRRSPVNNAEHLSVPLLVLHGLEDRVVPPEQAQAMVEAAARRGVPHAHLTFEGEGHGFRKPENVVAWLEAELGFLGDVMGFVPAGRPASPL